MMRRHRAGAAAAAFALAAALPLAAQELSYSGSAHVSGGSYIFSERTYTWTFSNGLGVRAGPLRLSGTLPLVVQNSWAITAVGGTMLPTGGPDAAAVRQRQSGQSVPMGQRRGSGTGGMGSHSLVPLAAVTATVVDSVTGPGSYGLHVGDPLLSGGLEVFRGWGALRSVEVTAATKAPVASIESGIGTGQWDYAGGISVALGGGRTLLFGDLAWWHYGDMPELRLRDGLAYAGGIGTPVTDRFSILASLAGAQRIIDEAAAPLSLSIGGSLRVAALNAVSTGISIGLSESSSAFSAFIGWRVGLDLAGRGSLAAQREAVR